MRIENITSDDSKMRKWYDLYSESFIIDYNNDKEDGIEYYRTLNNQEVRAEYYAVFEDEELVAGSLIFVMQRSIWILYLFTKENIRDKGIASFLINNINNYYPLNKFEYYVEVEMRTEPNRVLDWWKHRGYGEVPFEYVAPLMDDDTCREIGIIKYNKLLTKPLFNKQNKYNTLSTIDADIDIIIRKVVFSFHMNKLGFHELFYVLGNGRLRVIERH
jgi:hypothetical protein